MLAPALILQDRRALFPTHSFPARLAPRRHPLRMLAISQLSASAARIIASVTVFELKMTWRTIYLT